VKKTADTIVIGGGVIGLCVATAVARSGRSVIVVDEFRPGKASVAAAGMLAPSVEQSSGPAHAFAIAARDFYPDYLERLADTTGIRVPLNRLGILQVALTEKGVRGLRKTAPSSSVWLDRAELNELEPTLGHALGAVYNPADGAIDNSILMSALEAEVELTPRIGQMAGEVVEVSSRPDAAEVTLASGETLRGTDAVVAPGAWGSSIKGVPELSAISPCRGQLVSFRSIGLRHVTYGPRGYLVPRATGTTIAGSTMEYVGFDAKPTSDGLARVRSAAEEIAPGLAVADVTSQWAGLRPVTPDMLPIIGRDPVSPHVVYACGHSRNGILLAPLTGETVADVLEGNEPDHDLSQYRPGRF